MRFREDDMVGTLEAQLVLGAGDRCDRCGARAVARATMESGAHLLFCGHHLKAHEAGLRAVSARIERSTLDADSTVRNHAE